MRSGVVIGGAAAFVALVGGAVVAAGLAFGFPGSAGPAAEAPVITSGAAGLDADFDPAAGALDPGEAEYPVPAGALFVDVGAEPGGDGSEAAPYRSVERAVETAAPGTTIVVKEGVYHEDVGVFTPGLVIQSYPGDEVWLDGSIPVDGWIADHDGRWSRHGWDVDLDSSPTFTRGAPEDEEENWAFVDRQHPMAAHPDQVWIDDVPLRQVAHASDVVEGTFAVDAEADLLVVGTDPTAGTVHASTLPRAFQLRAEDVTVRGIGIRRYATSVPDMGTVTVELPGITLEHVVVAESATSGIFIGATDATLRSVTVERSGMIGLLANFADGLVLESVRSTENNTESFNRAPVAGGMKLTRSRNVVVSASDFSDNGGTGVWFDQSCDTLLVAGSRFERNAGHGLFVEISARALITGSVLADNARYGIKVNDTSDVVIRGNLVSGNEWGVAVLQDERRADADDARGLDARRTAADPPMTWINTDITVASNTLVGTGGHSLLWVQDYSKEFDAGNLRLLAYGNLYVRIAPDAPRTIITWQSSPGATTDFETVEDFTSATGQEVGGQVVSTEQVPAGPTAMPAFTWPDWVPAAWSAVLDGSG